jgi:RND family efflux transporter MFP subunit
MIGENRAIAGAMAALMLLAVLGLTGRAVAQGQGPALVGVDEVSLAPMSQTQGVVGRLVALDFSVVAARVEGPVQEVEINVGDRVERGAVLARLDQARLAAEVALREAEIEERSARLAAARAEVSLYRQELDRLEGLRRSAAFSQARYDDAAAEVERSIGQRAEAEASLARARVAHDLAVLELGYATIEAPFHGVVSERHVDAGEYVEIGAPIATLINDRDLEIEAAVPGDLIDNLDRGTVVTARLDSGLTVEASVRAIVPLEDTRTRTRRVRFSADLGSLDIPLASNQSAIVFVPVGEPRDVVTVHKDAVLSGPDGHSVFVVAEDGTAQPRPIALGEAVGNRFEVVDGLAPGDVVVTRGNESLRPGQAVRAQGS